MKTDFSRLCQQKKPASLIFPAQNLILQSRFSSVDPDQIRLALICPPAELSIAPFEPCSVVFTSFRRTYIFVAQTLEYQPEPEEVPFIALTVPETVVSGESRNSFRVPLHRNTGLEVTVKTPSASWHPRPVDISLGGILIDFAVGPVPNLEEDSSVTIVLSLQGQVTELESFIGRRDGSSYAAYFSEALRELRDGRRETPGRLAKIVDKLEKEWLSGPAA